MTHIEYFAFGLLIYMIASGIFFSYYVRTDLLDLRYHEWCTRHKYDPDYFSKRRALQELLKDVQNLSFKNRVLVFMSGMSFTPYVIMLEIRKRMRERK